MTSAAEGINTIEGKKVMIITIFNCKEYESPSPSAAGV